MPNASNTSPYHSVAHTHAATAISHGAGGLLAAGACDNRSLGGPSAQKISPSMIAIGVASATTGGLYAGTWKTLGRAICVHEYQARRLPKANRRAMATSAILLSQRSLRRRGKINSVRWIGAKTTKTL